MTTVEICSIGNELLRGIVQESNSYWLAKRIAARGAELRRAVLVPDEIDTVADAIRDALGRAPTLLLTHGGLGPTDDDQTREMIASALGVPLQHDDGAHAIVARRYRELADAGTVPDAELTDARLRMTYLPRGARAIDNQVGAAPAFAIEAGSTTIIALPGVPPELVWIWENPLGPLLDSLLGPGGFHETTLQLDLLDESRIAEMLGGLQARHPGVYVKSRAHGFEPGDEIRVTLAATAPSDAAAKTRCAAAEEELRAHLSRSDIAIRSQ